MRISCASSRARVPATKAAAVATLETTATAMPDAQDRSPTDCEMSSGVGGGTGAAFMRLPFNPRKRAQSRGKRRSPQERSSSSDRNPRYPIHSGAEHPQSQDDAQNEDRHRPRVEVANDGEKPGQLCELLRHSGGGGGGVTAAGAAPRAPRRGAGH